MSIHIGLMIWKEMKAKGISASVLALKLGTSKTKVQEILNYDNIDVVLLSRISEVLGYNFFSYYESSDVFSKIKSENNQKTTEEIKRLKEILQEKNKIIELKDQFIKSQASMINLFEKQQLR